MPQNDIVEPSEGVRCPCVVRGHADVRDEVNPWVQAPTIFAEHGNHLPVFTRLSTAQDFRGSLGMRESMEVHELKVRGIVEQPREGRSDVASVSRRTIPERRRDELS